MAKRRGILVFGAVICVAALGWSFWGVAVGLEEMHLSVSERTETFGGVAISLVIIGIVIMIASRFAREDT